MGSVATVGLAAGGILAFKSGKMSGLMHETIARMGQYRRGRIIAANTALRRYSEQEGLEGFGKSIGAFLRGDTHQARKHLDEFFDAFNSFGEKMRDGMTEHANRMRELAGKKLIDKEIESQSLFSSMNAMIKDLEKEGVSEEARVFAQKKMEDYRVKFGNLYFKEQELMMKRTGHRYATIQDLINAGEISHADEFVISGKNLYEQVTGNAEDFLHTRADRNVLIDMNGNISDLRDFRRSFIGFMESISTDFTIPLIKINPLRMFYTDQLFNTVEKPHFQVFRPTQRNPLVTGHNGAAQYPLFYADGEVFKMPTEAGGAIEKIEGDFFLSDAKRGPQARLVRNFAGISISKFNAPEANAPFLSRLRYNIQSALGLGFQDEPHGEFDLLDMTSWGAGAINAITRRFRYVDATKPQEYLKDAFGEDAAYFLMRRTKRIEDVGYKEFLKQFNASRDNMKDFTFASLFPYGFFERLNATLNQVGLGLPNQDLGSGAQIFGNLMLKRVAPIWAGYELWEYLNYESENFTGEQLSDRIAKAYANSSVEFAKLRDKLGITNWAKGVSPLLVGGEQLADFPMFGHFLDLDDNADETADYWQNGEVAVRKGRWWPLGNTPYTGAKIDYYQPNWVRRVLADAKFSDAQYGSREEYFQNSWMPTPRHPFAPIRHFFTDPYHWEKKHYDDRPFMVTGGLPELENFPLIGPVLNKTVGQVLKPEKRMHLEYWQGMPEEVTGGYEPAGFANMPPVTPAMAREISLTMAPIPGFDERRVVQTVDHDQNKAIAAYVTSSGQVQVVSAEDWQNYQKVKTHLSEISPTRSQYMKAERIREPEDDVPLESPISPSAWSQALGNLHYNASEMGGFYGFMGVSMTGEFGTKKPVWQSSHDMTSYSRAFWDLDIGGLGGDANEIWRRFVAKDQKITDVNPIRNQMPTWLPGPDYFTDFQHGDPYSKIKKGEIRLPGEAYERMYGIRAPQGEEKHGDQYGPIDRFRILSDVAPYSREYRDLESQFKFMDLEDDEKKEIQRIKQRVHDRKQRLRLYPYKYTTANLQNEFVTVDQVIDNNTFTTLEHPDNPIRFAGMHIPTGKDDPVAARAQEVIAHTIRPGKRIKIAYDADEQRRIKDDTYRTIQSVVYDAKNRNLNKYLLDQDLAKEKDNDYSPAAVHARFTDRQIAFGSLWEKFAHMDTILHTKFLQVRSPLESYERREVYGKDWQEWTDPVGDYLVPGIQNGMSHHPLFAIAAGGLIGAAFGSLKSGDLGHDGTRIMARYGKLVGGVMGASIMGSAVMYRVLYEHIKGEAWIPERRKKERDTEEYFDTLKYIKYNALYQQYADLALKREHFDVDSYLKEQKKEGADRKERLHALETAKRQLYVSRESDWPRIQQMLKELGIDADNKEEAKSKLNAEINSLTQHRELTPLSPYAAQAILYKQASKKTMYGYEAGDPMADVLAALPKKDRDYLVPFIDSPEEERGKILRIVPRYMRRILQSAWGQPVDEKEPLPQYFKEHPLPGKNWEGWREDVSMDDIKVKFVDRVGLDPSEFDIWPADKARAEQLNARIPNVFKGRETAMSYAEKLRGILHGKGLEDVDVEVVESDREGIHVEMDMSHDRRKDFQQLVNSQGKYVM